MDFLPSTSGDRSLDGMAIVVTGAGGVLGRAITRAVTDAGASAVLGDVALGPLGATSSHAIARQCDIRDATQVDALLQACLDGHGRVDAIVNAAGVIHVDHVLSVSVETLRDVFAVNVDAAMMVIQQSANLMRSQEGGPFGRRGMVISLSSKAAGFGRPWSPAYGSSKAALESLSASFADALIDDAVAVLTVSPGDVREGMLGGVLVKLAEVQGRSVPDLEAERRFQKPEDFAAIVVDCLATPGMSLNGVRVDPDRSISPLARIGAPHA